MRVLLRALAICLGILLSSCAELTLPQLDGGLLNPDIRFLRAGHIMECVKCAMVAFMHEREQGLLAEREAEPSGGPLHQIEGAYFSPYQVNVGKAVVLSLPGYRRCRYGEHYSYKPGGRLACVPNNCDAALARPLGASVWDYDILETNQTIKEKGCTSVPDYSRFALDPTQSANIQLTLVGANSGFIFYTQIDALRTPLYPFIQPGNRSTGAPFPMLQVSPKATTTFDVTAVMPQSVHTYQQTAHPSDFARDRSLPVSLTTKRIAEAPEEAGKANRGTEEIDELLKKAMEESTQAFPQLKVRAIARYKSIKEDCEKAANLAKYLPDPALQREYTKKVQDVCDRLVATQRRIAAQLPEEKPTPSRPQANEFMERCNIRTWSFDANDTTRIDFLALKRMLHNVVEYQERDVYRGIPDITLNSLILSSAFQLVLDASAGTKYFLRIVPVLVPPTLDLKADHTHTLKITVNGKKNKGDKQLPKRLYDSCRERVAPQDGGTSQVPEICATEIGQLLESIVQAVEKNAGSGSSTQ